MGITIARSLAGLTSTPADGSVTSAKIADGTIVNADVAAAAAIVESKLSMTGFVPADLGFLAWNFDPTMISGNNNTAMTPAGTPIVQRLRAPAAISVTNIELYMASGGTTLTAGQCFAAIYQPLTTLIGVTADQAAAWATSGLKTGALVGGPFAIAAGDFFVAMFYNGTTGPAPLRTGTVGFNNGKLSAANSKWATSNQTGRTTTMPATLGTLALSTPSYWCAVS